MNKLSYTRLLNDSLKLYLDDKYIEAYKYLTDNAGSVTGNMAQIYNFRYSFACKAGKIDLAMEIFREAIVDLGFWYSYEYLIDDDDLEPLHKFDDFEKLCLICKEREIEAKQKSKPEVKTILSNTKERNNDDTVIALHGDEENMDITEPYYAKAIELGYNVILPQSSQIGFSQGYFWTDLGISSTEIQAHSKMANGEIVLSGFSAGARSALHLVLCDYVKVKGLILISPWLPELEEWSSKIEKIKNLNTKLYIICGNKDDDCYEESVRLHVLLDSFNIEHKLKIIDGQDHDYPENFDQELERALKYINS